MACDMPSANAFMINVYAAVAQVERRMISDRTKAGLGAAKARGVKLGGPRRLARNQRNATGGRTGASTGHCADSLGVGWNVGPLGGCGVERTPGRDAKRRAVVCQDRHPSARAVGSLGKADKQRMDFAMSDPALVLRRANPSGSWSETDYDVTVAAIRRVSAGILLLGRWVPPRNDRGLRMRVLCSQSCAGS